MFSPELSNPATAGPEKYSVAEAQDKDFKIAIMNVCKDLKEEMNKSLNKACETLTNRDMNDENS